MKVRIQFGLLKLTDPRVVRILLVGLTLALTLLASGQVIYAAPACGDGGCGGG